MTVWELTRKCNLKCIHCGSNAGSTRQRELSTVEALHVCQDLSDLGCKGIALMGGEVFLRKDWSVIAKEIKNHQIVLSIITNGYITPTRILPLLAKIEPDCLMIGLDGSSAETHDKIRGVTGAFAKTMTFIRAAKKILLPVNVITTIHKGNFKELPKLRDLILREELSWQIQEASPIGRFPRQLMLSEKEYYALGLYLAFLQKTTTLKQLSIIGAHNLGFHSKILPAFSSYPKWSGCYAGKTVLGITSNGDVKGCLALPDEYVEGNVRKKKISDIWNDPTTFAYTRAPQKQSLGSNCQGCRYKKSCKGGCTTRSHGITSVPHNDPHCFYRIEQGATI
jgi:radical SAM protein with 4Fe4S-binding SPASM domain